MYEGTSKILVQGTEGESLVTASVSYLDGVEQGRTVTSTETVREPTTTTKAVGTKERPKTMPTGTFQWPIRGRIISHGSGVQTYYAHCSSLLVSAGAEVYKGQAIARVGSTGRSTGNHCHFEIRINGTAVNPLSYLP